MIFLTTYDLSSTDFEESDGRLFSVSHSPTDILTYAARELAPDLRDATLDAGHYEVFDPEHLDRLAAEIGAFTGVELTGAAR